MNGLSLAAESKRTDTGLIWLCKLNNLKITAAEQAIHKGDEITPGILRLVRYFLKRGQDVVILSRRKGIPWYINYNDNAYEVTDALTRFLEHIRSNLPEEDRKRVTISTAHGYKGLEESAVIMVDAVDRSYPLVHPAWAFLRVFGDSIDRIVDEERRLFYVAITRAKQSLALVTESNIESPYLGNIHQVVHIESLSWEKLTPVPSLDSPRIEVRVLNAYGVKDQLKDRGYRYNPHGKYWQKAVMVGDFSLDELLRQAWTKGNVKIEVYNEEGQLLHRR